MKECGDHEDLDEYLYSRTCVLCQLEAYRHAQEQLEARLEGAEEAINDAIAQLIANDIQRDICGRGGIGYEFDEIDDDTKQEIIDEWVLMIRKRLATHN